MQRSPSVRHVLLVCLVACALIALPAIAFAEEAAEPAEPALIAEPTDTSFEGMYAISGSTDTGKPFTSTVRVTSLGESIQFSALVMGFSVTTAGEAGWNGPDQISVPVAANLRIASGSGTITLTRGASGLWDMTGSGSGSVFTLSGMKEGNVTFAGSQAGAPPTAVQVAEVTGVPEQISEVSDIVEPLAPDDPQGELETDQRVNALVALFLVALLLVVLEIALGFLFL